jgi:hypothetical protein
MPYHRICDKSIMTGVNSGARTAYPSRDTECIPGSLEVTASTYPLGNIRSVASLLTYTIYQKYMTGSTSSAMYYKL